MSKNRSLKKAVFQTSKLALLVTSSNGKILVLGSMVILTMCLSGRSQQLVGKATCQAPDGARITTPPFFASKVSLMSFALNNRAN